MSIIVEDKTKVIIVKIGPNKLFGDWDERQKMSDNQRIELFDNIWKAQLKDAINRAVLNSAAYRELESAYEKLKDSYQAFFQFDQEHREFQLRGIWFIAQVASLPNNDKELTQLWPIRSTDYDPKVLYIRFDTVEERKQFRDLANFLGHNDEQLGKQLILEFMAKLPDTLVLDIESFKRQLSQRRRNLNYLNEQSAMYSAADVPLDLHNKIEAEKVAIAMLENRINTWDEEP